MFLGTTLSVVIGAIRPFILRDMVNIFTAPERDVDALMQLFRQYCLLAAGIFAAYRVYDYSIVYFELRGLNDLALRSFSALQKQSIRFFEDAFAGSLVKCSSRFRDSFEDIVETFFLELLRSFLMISSGMIIFFMEQPTFGALFAAWVILFGAFLYVSVRIKLPLDAAVAEADSNVSGALADSLSNEFTVKSFGCERLEYERFTRVMDNCLRVWKRSWLTGNMILAIQACLVCFAEVGIVWWLIIGWENGTANAGDFIFFQTYVVWVLGELWGFSYAIRRVMTAVAQAKEMVDILEKKPEVVDAPGAHNLRLVEGQIEMHQLHFKYGQSEEEGFCLNGLTLHIPAGQSIGIVGKTGAGKSTFAKLLMRHYDLQAGYIRIDMQDIADVTQQSLRQQMGVVSQQPQLFHRSIRDNIAFARPDATDDEITEAAKQAYAWEFIEKLPQGLDTMVGERGVKLSGGQCQRIAIARAILADPRILLLDEATSALDSETEKYIQKAIENLLRGRTSIVIAHRLSTIMRMDRIVVMEHGKIIEDGKHDDLLRQKGMYANLWKHQSGGYIASEK